MFMDITCLPNTLGNLSSDLHLHDGQNSDIQPRIYVTKYFPTNLWIIMVFNNAPDAINPSLIAFVPGKKNPTRGY
jgi:hypothetical protein